MERKRVPGIYYIREAIQAKNKKNESKKYVVKHRSVEKKDKDTINITTKTNEKTNSNYLGNIHTENVIQENYAEDAFQESNVYYSEPEIYSRNYGFKYTSQQSKGIFNGKGFSEKYIGLIALGVVILLKSRKNIF